jgi:O-methyltransferase domain
MVRVDADALYRLLRALASLGIFVETTDARFEMTPAATLLQRNTPGSLRSAAMLYGDELLWRSFGRMLYAIETGRPAFEYVYGQPFYDYLGEHPESAMLFHEAMTGFSEMESEAIIAACDVSQIRTVVDVGGGQGALIAALLRAHQHLEAVIFDRSGPTPDTQNNFAIADIAGRARFIQGDFFNQVPDGGDLYLLKSILQQLG